MAVRFNPPPGWQVPPGFRPDAGWAPDPAWPPAPPGWEYWVDAAAAPAAPAAPAPSHGPRPEAPAESTTVLAPVRTPAPPAAAATAVHSAAHSPVQAPVHSAAPTVVGQEPVQTVTAPPAPSRASRRSGSTVIPLGGATPADAPPAAGMPPGGADARTRGTRGDGRARSGRPSNMIIGGVAAACLALGCILGVTVSMMRSSDAAQARVDARQELQQAEQLRAEAAQEREDLAGLRKDVEEREKAVKEREKEASAKEADLTSRQNELDEQKTQQEQAAQQQQQEQQQQEQNTGGALFYWDCNAARQAGAAPIQRDQPAYRRALDSNGNGIACEDGE